MKRLTFTAGVALCAIVLASGMAVAKSGHDRSPVTFESLDADQNGEISRAEMQASRASHLLRADTNGDGQLSLEELEAQGAERAKAGAERMMSQLDTNEDGALSQEEMLGGQRATRRFDRVDRDGDGVISQSEFEAAQDRMAKRRPVDE